MVVAALFYLHRPKKTLVTMPTTIASILSLFEGSSLADCGGKWDRDWRFGYGRFIGTDGALRIGIERHPLCSATADKAFCSFDGFE